MNRSCLSELLGIVIKLDYYKIIYIKFSYIIIYIFRNFVFNGVEIMSLFSRLYDLLKTSSTDVREDYLSEIFAQVIKNNNIFCEFVEKFLGLYIRYVSELKIETQKIYGKLRNHDMDSRPDIVIQFKDRKLNIDYIIFIESKLSATEGDKQLQRYAEHLGRIKNKYSRKTYLLYLTEYFDPKDEKDIFDKDKTCEFLQYRWYQIYKWLNEVTFKNMLKDCLLEYMEEMGMDKSRKFLPQDIYALQNSSRLFQMIDEIVDGKIDEILKNYFGRPYQPSNRFTQLRYHDRYVKYVPLCNSTMGVFLGVELTNEIYPVFTTVLEVSPKNAQRDLINDCAKEFIEKNPDFQLDSMMDDSRWGYFYREKPLIGFMTEEDHIKGIEVFFSESLNKLKEFKDTYTKINWE